MTLTSFSQLTYSGPQCASPTPYQKPVNVSFVVLPDNRGKVDDRMATPRTNTTTAPSRSGLSPFISRDPNFARYHGRPVYLHINTKNRKKVTKPKKRKPVFDSGFEMEVRKLTGF